MYFRSFLIFKGHDSSYSFVFINLSVYPNIGWNAKTAFSYKPKNIVSGDFYWFKKAEIFTKTYHIFTVADCTGHGVPGAFMSMLGISFLTDIIKEFYTELDVAEILNRMREEVKSHLHQEEGARIVKDGMDMAICAIDYDEMILQYAGANNPLYILRYNNGSYSRQIEELKPDKMPIGKHPRDSNPFAKHNIPVNKGDLIYAFSDGYQDQFGGKNGDKFLRKRLRELFSEISSSPLSEQKNILDSTLSKWTGDNYQQVDDITIIGVKV